jgi:hypothetical protein
MVHLEEHTALHSKGEGNGMASLTADKVMAMRAMRRAGATLREIAERHGVSIGHAHRVVSGKRWKHV